MKKVLLNARSLPSFLALLLVLLCSVQVQGQTLVQYNASALPAAINPNVPVFSSNANITATPITRGAGLVGELGTAALNSSNWPAAGSAPNNNQYYTFTLTAHPGFIMDLRNAVFRVDCKRNNSNGVIAAYVFTSADGFSTPASTIAITNNSVQQMVCTLPNTTAFANLFNIEIRIYADGASQANRQLAIQDPVANSGNIEINGGSVIYYASQLTSAWCGATNMTISQMIAAQTISGATNYEFNFQNASLGYNYSRVKGNGIPTMPLSWITGLQYGNTYEVRVRAFIGGTWRPYGAMCLVGLQSTIPTPQLLNCAMTNMTLSSALSVTPIAGAQDYMYLVTNAAQPYNYVRTMGSPTSSMTLSWFPNLQYGRTYSVQVKAKVGGVWGAYGPVCTFTMQSTVPTPAVLSCGNVQALSAPLYCSAIVGATDYEWLFVGDSLTFTRQRGSNLTSMYPVSIPGFIEGNYLVSVKAKVGGVWGTVYGSACLVTIGSSARLADEETEQTSASNLVSFSTSLFPNPIGTGIAPSVTINGADGQFAIIKIYDLTGKEIVAYGIQVEGQEFIAVLSAFPVLNAGMYMMTVTINDDTHTSRFIVE